MISENNLKVELFNHKVYSAWQFIQFTKKNIETVRYCYQTINNIQDKMAIKTVRWEQNLYEDFAENVVVDGKKAQRVTIRTDNMPTYELHVAGEKVDPWFLFDKLLRDFFQYAMNAFDSISQVANAGLLANKGRKVDTVDFQRMVACFKQMTYKADFPNTSSWFERIEASSEYQYIEAINNRTKHTADIANKLSMGILGSSNSARIGPFFRKNVQHTEKELTDQLYATLDFVELSFRDFIDAFCDEFILDKYTDNRYHEIDGVYQQKLKEKPNQNLSYAYITSEKDFSSMPDEIYVLLAKNTDEIYAHICPFEHILVCGEDLLNVHGRYNAEDYAGEDCLLGYRKYTKDTQTPGPTCLINEMREDAIFYHQNRFFNITAVSDDNSFLGRSSLPF